jgi:hypothetical protein
MEWFWAIGFAVAMLLWSGIYLIRKLLRFGPPAKKLAAQLEALNAANAKVPEIAKALSALGDDPAVHIARRQQLLREARERKRQRERRLRSRDF